ncbi:hypothetical protein FB451DRAFT_1258589 [Mycena latifolia]|nr:hypothetical protein FB451DRAFT_1257677 [Mycena latifolia]KAJ7468222.1 hypothetical protein FB451DRAFT_1258589 [Mycena latifolia]
MCQGRKERRRVQISGAGQKNVQLRINQNFREVGREGVRRRSELSDVAMCPCLLDGKLRLLHHELCLLRSNLCGLHFNPQRGRGHKVAIRVIKLGLDFLEHALIRTEVEDTRDAAGERDALQGAADFVDEDCESFNAFLHRRGDCRDIGNGIRNDIKDLVRAECDIACVGFRMFGALSNVTNRDDASDGALQGGEGVRGFF